MKSVRRLSRRLLRASILGLVQPGRRQRLAWRTILAAAVMAPIVLRQRRAGIRTAASGLEGE